MAKFKIGDKVIPSKKMREQCEVSVWFKDVKDKVENDGYLVVSHIYGNSAYQMKGLPSVVFDEEWLVPYIDCEPSPSHLGRPAYMPRDIFLPEDVLSVRDRFAMAALSGMLAHSTRYKPREEGADWHWSIAKEAYELADAMMKRREK